MQRTVKHASTQKARRSRSKATLRRSYRRNRYATLLAEHEGCPGEDVFDLGILESHPWADCPCCQPLDPEETRRVMHDVQGLHPLDGRVWHWFVGSMRLALRGAGL